MKNSIKNQKVCESKWPTWQVVETKKETKRRERTPEKKSKEEKEPESRATIDMKTRIVPKVTNATRCCAIPLGENAKPFQKDMTGFPKTDKQ